MDRTASQEMFKESEAIVEKEKDKGTIANKAAVASFDVLQSRYPKNNHLWNYWTKIANLNRNPPDNLDQLLDIIKMSSKRNKDHLAMSWSTAQLNSGIQKLPRPTRSDYNQK